MVIKSSPWDAPELLELNRQRVLADAREQMRCYEAQYGLPSDRLEEALTAGKMTETPEVGRWLFALYTFHSLSNA